MALTIFWNLYQRITEEKRMVDTKKEQERDELHRAIWAIADDCVEQSMVGTSKIMFLARCSIVIFPKTCVIT